MGHCSYCGKSTREPNSSCPYNPTAHRAVGGGGLAPATTEDSESSLISAVLVAEGASAVFSDAAIDFTAPSPETPSSDSSFEGFGGGDSGGGGASSDF